jgi:AbiU2
MARMTASGTIMQVSEKFHACRVLVHDDAFEAQITLHMVLPLLKNTLRELKRDYLYKSGVFLRRSLTRYLVLALFRLIDKPNASGATGVTASISSLLEMAKAEGVLSDDQIKKFADDFNKIKSDGAQGEYDLVQAIRNLRTIQVAHSLIPNADPTDQVWAHDLADFAEAIFNFVVDLEAALEKATGITLTDLRENADAFEADAGQFWRALTSMT